MMCMDTYYRTPHRDSKRSKSSRTFLTRTEAGEKIVDVEGYLESALAPPNAVIRVQTP